MTSQVSSKLTRHTKHCHEMVHALNFSFKNCLKKQCYFFKTLRKIQFEYFLWWKHELFEIMLFRLCWVIPGQSLRCRIHPQPNRFGLSFYCLKIKTWSDMWPTHQNFSLISYNISRLIALWKVFVVTLSTLQWNKPLSNQSCNMKTYSASLLRSFLREKILQGKSRERKIFCRDQKDNFARIIRNKILCCIFLINFRCLWLLNFKKSFK